MRENRTYGSEGGETGKPVFPTPIIGRYRRRGIPPRFLRADLGLFESLAGGAYNHIE